MMKKPLFLRVLTFVLTLTLLISSCVAEGTENHELAEGADIRIMSYNLMNPDWSKAPVAGRDQNVVSIIQYYQPDVIGLQEANGKWQKALKPVLVETGLYSPACRQSNAAGFKYNMTTFMYNVATVQLVEERVVDLDPGSDIRVFAVAVFEKLSDGSRFVVANTHPASSTDTEVYARNCADILEIGAAEMAQYADLPFIMTGDYNTRESSDMYKTFMDTLGVKDAKYEADVLVRDQGTYFEWGTEPTPNADDCVDHIFVNSKTAVKLYNVVIDHDVQNTSDHFPIYADIDLQ